MSSATSAPALDVNQLNFDTCERLRHLDWLLKQLGIGKGARILDAGGYPCYMARAFPRRTIITADMYASGHAPYVRASGAALPFPDNTFDATIACDVLEHVPPVHREAFLRELTRVSSRAVIVAGPYTTPGAEQAEQTVRSLLPESSPAQMWLAEHTECGLPSLDNSINTFHGAGALDVMALPVGSLTEWMLFFAGQAAGERDHSAAEAMESFIYAYNRIHTRPGVSHAEPAYRHAIVAALDDKIMSALKQLATDAGPDEIIGITTAGPDAFDREQVESYVDSLGALLRTFMHSRPAATDSDSMDSLTEEYIRRLEMMLSHRGMQPPQRPAPGDTTHNGAKQRLKAAWNALRGR